MSTPLPPAGPPAPSASSAPSAPSARPRPYRRRRPRPIAVTAAVLAVLAAAIWSGVLIGSPGAEAKTSCSPPAQGAVPGAVLDRSALDRTTPAAPRDVRFSVLNAGGQRGQANLVSAQLGDLEFAETAPPTNDPRYPQGDLDCVGQLRFGTAGEPAAATLALVLPCVELVRDDRTGPGVDVVIGAAFTDVSPGRAARDVLDELSAPAGENGQRAAVDPAVLDQARSATCQ